LLLFIFWLCSVGSEKIIKLDYPVRHITILLNIFIFDMYCFIYI